MRFNRFCLLAVSLLLALSVISCTKKESEEPPSGGGDTSEIADFSKRAQMLESALKDDPKNPDLLVQAGNLYYDWGEDEVNKKGDSAQPVDKWTRAVEYYRRALGIKPDNVNVRVDMANLMRYTGQPDQAIAEYRTAIKQDPKHPQARINLVLALGQIKQDYKAAITEYDALLKAIPDQKNNAALKQEVDAFREAMKEAKK